VSAKTTTATATATATAAATAAAQRRERPARQRILDTAVGLFYAEGVHTVGIDRIIAEAGVAKATFYHHFPAKDDLVRAYLSEQLTRQRAAASSARVSLSDAGPRQTLMRMFVLMGEFGAGADYRGCPFINAAAEYPDPSHPVRQVIADHRRWFRDLLRELLTELGDPEPDRTADLLMLLRDGISVGADLDDADVLRDVIPDAVTRLLPQPTAAGA
jgi:AcrR family transcriptional regulator